LHRLKLLQQENYTIIRQLSEQTRVINAGPQPIRISIMSTHMPPVPPANRNQKGKRGDPGVCQDKPVKHEHHANSAEEGETANIKQNTTNKGFFRGRRLG
jgi:hypothetical protein